MSLAVIRIYWRSLFAWAILGALPFALLNAFCLHRIANVDSMLIYNYDVLDPSFLRTRYVLWMTALVFLEAPLALLGVTFFLGQSVFFGSPKLADFRAAFKQSFGGLLWVLGIFRLGALAWLAPLSLTSESQVDLFLEGFLYGFILVGSNAIIRAVRPFAPEMLILERSPLRSNGIKDDERGMVYGKRSVWLHSPVSGELFRRSIASSIVSFFLLGSLSFGWLFLTSIFFSVSTWDWWMDLLLFPLTLWIVAVFATVIRFLSYLDTRTRLEGWELVLRLKAEGQRVNEAME